MPNLFKRRAPALLVLCLAIGVSPPAFAADSHQSLVKLWRDWRAFEPPTVEGCVPDYSAAAMAQKAERLGDFQAKLAAIDAQGWTKARFIDRKIVAAEMNGMDFDMRVLKPWARDPSFYATVFAEESDVPEHEGPNAYPAIDLYTYKYPLSKKDQKALTCLIGAIPAILDRAKTNLEGSNARDLWVYGDRAFRWQDEALAALAAGTLDMRTLEGNVRGTLEGAGPELVAAVTSARAATADFRKWLKEEAPSKTGEAGVGKENYDWYMKNVMLSPYGWDEQVTLLRRELERARASLELEEFNNRNLPPMKSFDEEGAYLEMARTKMSALADFLINNGLVDDKAYFRDALANEVGAFTPPQERNFFSIGSAFDPSPLYSHFYHWIELAMRKHEPVKSPIRAATPLYDMYDGRSEGMATAVEELFMQAGLYDESPRSREIVWIMLANRAARGLASLYAQSNDMSLDEAGKFHASWTPRKWSDASSDLVGFEQLLYLRQPGYGSSYITGKLELDRLVSEYAFEREQKGEAFSLPEFFDNLNASGVIPFALIGEDMTDGPLKAGE